eukprot:12003684-Alexandrium_andersonii.AAC.1
MKNLWDVLDGQARADATSAIHAKIMEAAPRFHAALLRQDTDVAWGHWNAAINGVWSRASEAND